MLDNMKIERGEEVAKFTKKAIMMCFMELLEEKQIDKITVKDICENCEINRNTFYYYYCDIYAVLTEVFEYEKEKVLKELDENSTFYDEYRRYASVILNNKRAIIHIYKSKSNYVLSEYLETVTMNFVERFVRKKAENALLPERDIDYITKFYSYSIIGHTMKWIEEGLREYDNDLLKKIANTFDNTIDAMIQSCKSENQTY